MVFKHQSSENYNFEKHNTLETLFNFVITYKEINNPKFLYFNFIKNLDLIFKLLIKY